MHKPFRRLFNYRSVYLCTVSLRPKSYSLLSPASRLHYLSRHSFRPLSWRAPAGTAGFTVRVRENAARQTTKRERQSLVSKSLGPPPPTCSVGFKIPSTHLPPTRLAPSALLLFLFSLPPSIPPTVLFISEGEGRAEPLHKEFQGFCADFVFPLVQFENHFGLN